MTPKLRFSLSLVCLFANLMLCAQSGGVQHLVFSKKDGLAIDEVNTLAFDDDGFLWLGGLNLDTRAIVLKDTKSIIQRFNGAGFHTIYLPEDRGRITSVIYMVKRNDGKIYITAETEKGHVMYLFDPYEITFQGIDFPEKGVSINTLSLPFFYEGKTYVLSQFDRTIVVNTIDEDALFIKPLFHFTSSENKFALDKSTTFFPSKEGIVIGDDNFPIMFFDWEGNLLQRYASETFIRDRNTLVDKFYIDEYFEVNDTLFSFIQGRSKLHYLDLENKEIRPISHSKAFEVEDVSRQLVRDKKGGHLVAVNRTGSLEFLTKTPKGFTRKLQLNGFDRLPNYQLITEDVNESVWISTNDGELHYVKFPSKKVSTYLTNEGIRTIKQIDSTKFIVATDAKGWFILDIKNNAVTPYKVLENESAYSPVYTRNIIDEGDYYWSNSHGNILKIDKATNKAEAYRHYPVACMIKPNDSSIIYGTKGYNLMRFDTKTKQHSPLIKTDTLDIFGLALKPESEVVVLGTSKGIVTYNLRTNEVKVKSGEVLEDAFILSTMYHKDFGYLLGTREGYILQLDPETMVTKVLYKDELSAGIATILFEDDGTWWINTFDGIVAYDTKTKLSTRFSINDGFSNNETNRYSALKTDQGMFVGTIKGLNYFDPLKLKPETDTRSLVPLRMRKYDKGTGQYTDILNRSAFAKAKTITLPAENRLLELDFVLTGLEPNGGERYQYRLNEGEWINLKNQNQLSFPNLSSGDYLLEVEALDYSGNKVGETLTMSIDAQDFFYKSWWFYVLLSLVSISVLLWFMYQYRLRSKMQEQFSRGLLSSQEEERNRIAKELHDSVGQQLTLIKQFAQKEQKDEIATLTNKALNEVRSISRGLYPALLKQLGLTGSIEQLLLEVDEQTSLFVSVEIDEIDNYFSPENGLNFYRFIQENVSNVVKHANAKALSVSIEKLPSKIIAAIKDNGTGFNVMQAQKRNSLGLKTLEERIKILKGTLDIQSTSKGTIITAEIPIDS